MHKMLKWFLVLLTCYLGITTYVGSGTMISIPDKQYKLEQFKYEYAPIIMQYMRSRTTYKQKVAWCDSILESTFNYCDEYNLDLVWALSLYMQESTFYPKAKGAIGDAGLTQITNSAIVEYERFHKIKINKKDIYNIDTNIKIGLWYLSNKLEQNNDNYKISFAKYNAGKYWQTKGISYYLQVLRKKELILCMKYDRLVQL